MARRDDSDQLAVRFGRNLFRVRRATGLSQEDMRLRADLHRTHIGAIERGRRLPRLDTIIKLAAGSEVPPADLLDGMAWLLPSADQPGGRFIVVGERR